MKLYLNNPEFQTNLLSLAKQEVWAVLKTLPLLKAMTWHQLQSSKGLRCYGSTRTRFRLSLMDLAGTGYQVPTDALIKAHKPAAMGNGKLQESDRRVGT